MNHLTVLYFSFPLSTFLTNVDDACEKMLSVNLGVRGVKRGKRKGVQGILYVSAEFNVLNCFCKLLAMTHSTCQT